MTVPLEPRILALLNTAHPFDVDLRRPPAKWERLVMHPRGQAVVMVGSLQWRPEAAFVRWGFDGQDALPALADLLGDLVGAWTARWYGDLPTPDWLQQSGVRVFDDSSYTKHRYATAPVVNDPGQPVVVVTQLSDLPDLRAASLWQLWCEGLSDQPDDEQDLPALDAWGQEWDAALATGGALMTIWDGDEAIAASGVARTGELAYVRATAVRRAFRGRGLSRPLKHAVSTWACKVGIGTVLTDVRQSNPAMLATNEALGYRRVPQWFAEGGEPPA